MYAHGRMDGEINSTAFAEAMSFGLPVVTHTSSINQGYVEQVDGIGFVAKDVIEYARALEALIQDDELRRHLGACSRERFAERYALRSQFKVVELIYEKVLKGEASPAPQLWCWIRQSRARAVRFSRRLVGLR